MGSKSKLAATIGAIVGGSLLAFCCGLLLTVAVIVPVREGRGFPPEPRGLPTAVTSPSAEVGPITRSTPLAPSPTPTYSIIVSAPTPWSPTSTPASSLTATPEQQPTSPASPTPAQGAFSFYYVEGSRVEELQCAQPYLRGWVQDAAGEPMNGVTVEWRYWNKIDHAISGDPALYWQLGEFKFTYIVDDPNLETDFVLQVVESADNPVPLSEPLLIHYAGCATMGQITNVVFKHY
ncbi:MAG TPA: hypothetical protein VJ714_04875 [Anaerolineae bacterium]|nr:hypothetical protein [Anaerolineae bacterium]